jgi:hypothetical protein
MKSLTKQFREACFSGDLAAVRRLHSKVSLKSASEIFIGTCTRVQSGHGARPEAKSERCPDFAATSLPRVREHASRSHLDVVKYLCGKFKFDVDTIMTAINHEFDTHIYEDNDTSMDLFEWLIEKYEEEPFFSNAISRFSKNKFEQACIDGDINLGEYLDHIFLIRYDPSNVATNYVNCITAQELEMARWLVENFVNSDFLEFRNPGQVKEDMNILLLSTIMSRNNEHIEWYINHLHLTVDDFHHKKNVVIKQACDMNLFSHVNFIINKLDIPPDFICEKYIDDPRLVFKELGPKYALFK